MDQRNDENVVTDDGGQTTEYDTSDAVGTPLDGLAWTNVIDDTPIQNVFDTTSDEESETENSQPSVIFGAEMRNYNIVQH